mmetsp:Transcript_3791/g.8264  ORF Transcript_3791/g.8264 Transcript_3791/m.8264 type:complete len:104 (-) Transcript_3791:989-1300(-)
MLITLTSSLIFALGVTFGSAFGSTASLNVEAGAGAGAMSYADVGAVSCVDVGTTGVPFTNIFINTFGAGTASMVTLAPSTAGAVGAAAELAFIVRRRSAKTAL